MLNNDINEINIKGSLNKIAIKKTKKRKKETKGKGRVGSPLGDASFALDSFSDDYTALF